MIMSAMREKTKIVLFAVLIAFVGFIFFQWGMDMTRRTPHSGAVGKVNGQTISAEAYRKTRQQVVQTYENRSGRPRGVGQRRHRGGDLDRSRPRGLLQDQVKKYGIRISDAEILELEDESPDAIRQQFHERQGQFDTASYQRALSDRRSRRSGPAWRNTSAPRCPPTSCRTT
jgi:hypothetical protein